MIIADELIAKEITQPPKIHKHAKERALERYEMSATEFSALVNKNIKSFEFIAVTNGYEGRPSRMFTFDGKVFLLALTENLMITTFPCNGLKAERYVSRLKNKISGILQHEIERIERKEARKLREIARYRADLEFELANLRRKLTTLRSTPKRIAYQAQIIAIEMRINDFVEDIAEVQVQKVREIQATLSLLKGGVAV